MIQHNLQISNKIDLYRGFLCQYVIFSHLIPTLFPAILGTPGTLAVWCFFIISGYLNYYSYLNSNSVKEYFLKRMKRLYPLLFISYLVIAYIEKNPFINDLYTLVPAVIKVKESMPLNGVLWTIVIELQLYLLTPLLFQTWKILDRYRNTTPLKLVLIFGACSIILAGASSRVIVRLYDFDDRMIFSAIPFYLYGMFIARNGRHHYSITDKENKLFFMVALILFIFVVFTRNFGGLWSHLFIEGRFVPFLMSAAILCYAGFSVRARGVKNFFVLLGKATYEIYLFHGFFVYFLYKVTPFENQKIWVVTFFWVLPVLFGLVFFGLTKKMPWIKNRQLKERVAA